MTDLIDAPGEYVTRGAARVNIIAVVGGWAMGLYKDIEGGNAHTWHARNGFSNCNYSGAFDIIAKAPPPAAKKIGPVAVWVWPGGYKEFEEQVFPPRNLTGVRRIYMIETDAPEGETT